ncbi:hypothetical protein LSTR_LSTR014214 [Laodelphax striatellus]|uniref:C2H2-type domain-containing protein n=1 Tax=Laodelphax striatellus TaxID=195883 RepID=A0A482WTT1_LAOST|nr:hypothetical protein LSTR_LSTR014214 [Laodelphax striatellus]
MSVWLCFNLIFQMSDKSAADSCDSKEESEEEGREVEESEVILCCPQTDKEYEMSRREEEIKDGLSTEDPLLEEAEEEEGDEEEEETDGQSYFIDGQKFIIKEIDKDAIKEAFVQKILQGENKRGKAVGNGSTSNKEQESENGGFGEHFLIGDGSKPYKCNVCAFSCAQQANLTRHLKTHSGEKHFACTVCDFRSAQHANLTRHMLRHTGEKQFECPVCAGKFTQQSNLTRHMARHTGEKQFECTVCEFRSAQLSNLKRHLAKHKNQKPVQCCLCGFRCVASQYRHHLKTAHCGIEDGMYACNRCEYSCRKSTNIVAHMRTVHTGEEEQSSAFQFQCKLCAYSCTQLKSLRIHCSRVHCEGGGDS